MNPKNYTVKELTRYCRDHKIRGFSGKRKAQLLMIVSTHKSTQYRGGYLPIELLTEIGNRCNPFTSIMMGNTNKELNKKLTSNNNNQKLIILRFLLKNIKLNLRYKEDSGDRIICFPDVYQKTYGLLMQDTFIKAKFDNWKSDPDVSLRLLSCDFVTFNLLSGNLLIRKDIQVAIFSKDTASASLRWMINHNITINNEALVEACKVNYHILKYLPSNLLTPELIIKVMKLKVCCCQLGAF